MASFDLFGANLRKKFIFAQNLKIMIQRIQSVYLFIAALLVGFLVLFPYAEIAKDGVVYVSNIKGITLDGASKASGIFVTVLIGAILVLHGYAILSFKNRKSQIRLVAICILLIICLCGLFSYYTYGSFSGALISLKISMAFPLIAIILDYLAIRAIGKDEALIRSIDRIR